jgi:hypothetical protein
MAKTKKQCKRKTTKKQKKKPKCSRKVDLTTLPGFQKDYAAGLVTQGCAQSVQDNWPFCACDPSVPKEKKCGLPTFPGPICYTASGLPGVQGKGKICVSRVAINHMLQKKLAQG